MSRKNILGMDLFRCLAVVSALTLTEAIAQVEVIPADEAKARLSAPDNGFDFNAMNRRNDDAANEKGEEEGWVQDARANVTAAEKEDNLDVNRIVVAGEMFLWNRFADVIDFFRIGIGGGVGIGAEAAVTDYANLGAYYNYMERGVDCSILPIVDYYDKTPVFVVHDTTPAYGTVAFGPWRMETIQAALKKDYLYPRNRWDIRVQANLALVSAYVAVRPTEIVDFFAGFIGLDPSDDDDKADENVVRQPVDQLGRGICNVAFGALEVPFNILRVTEQEGDLPGLSKGTLLGVWRCVCREITGVVEIVTFPFGWRPIIEPEYVFQKKRGVVWRTNRPTFYKKYHK